MASESPALGLKLEPHFDVKLAMNSGRHNSCRGNLGRQPTGYEVADERAAFQLPASLPSPLRQVLLNCMRSAQCSSGFCNIGSKRPPAMVGSAQLHDDEMLFSSEIAASLRPFLVVFQFIDIPISILHSSWTQITWDAPNACHESKEIEMVNPHFHSKFLYQMFDMAFLF